MNTKPLRVWINKMIKAYCPAWILKRMTLCRDILPWLEKKEELTLWQKIELRFHIFICPPCWDYEKELNMISKAFKKMFKVKNSAEQDSRLEKVENEVLKKHCCHKHD